MYSLDADSPVSCNIMSISLILFTLPSAPFIINQITNDFQIAIRHFYFNHSIWLCCPYRHPEWSFYCGFQGYPVCCCGSIHSPNRTSLSVVVLSRQSIFPVSHAPGRLRHTIPRYTGCMCHNPPALYTGVSLQFYPELFQLP